jgi:hypothetical protein
MVRIPSTLRTAREHSSGGWRLTPNCVTPPPLRLADIVGSTASLLSGQSIANQVWTCASWSTQRSPETSTTTLSMVPPVSRNGAVYSGVTGESLSRPTQMPSSTSQKNPGLGG